MVVYMKSMYTIKKLANSLASLYKICILHNITFEKFSYSSKSIVYIGNNRKK